MKERKEGRKKTNHLRDSFLIFERKKLKSYRSRNTQNHKAD